MMPATQPGTRRAVYYPPMAIFAALVVFCAGVINILSALIGITHERLLILRSYLPLEVDHGSRTLTVLAGMLLLLLSWSLLRRKHQGWLAAIVVLATSAVLHLMKGLDFEESLFTLFVLVILLLARREFVVRSDARALPSALIISVATVAVSLCYGLLGFFLLRHHFAPAFTFGRCLHSTLALLTQAVSPSLLPIPGHRDAFWFEDSLVAAAFISALYIVGALLRPVAASLHALDHEREEVRRLLRAEGAPPLAYWALLPGLSYFFSEHRTAVIPYKVVDDVAITLGDPLGHPDAIPSLVKTFAYHCLTNDWRPAWYQVTQRWLPLCQTMGWSAVKIGEDALLDVSELTFSGKKWQDVRTALNRLPKEGYSAVWYDITTDPAGWLPALSAISREWLSRQHGEEKGFSLSTWDNVQQYAREQRLLALQAPNGMPVAFLTFVPIFGAPGGWGLDLMRRSLDAPASTVEYLLATALHAFHAEGAAVISLGLSPLSDVTPEDASNSPELLDRIRELVFEHFNALYSFQGLHHFKEKFQPRWEARYLVYPSLLSLPKVLVALIRAHSAGRQSRGLHTRLWRK